MAKRLCQKLVAKFYGPFHITKRIGKAAYRLKLPDDSKIHHVFHISQLKHVLGVQHHVMPLPQSFSGADEVVIEPDHVLDTRYSPDGVLEILVKWTGLPDHDSSWEDVREISHLFPSFLLEDKLHFVCGGIDKLKRVYVRKSCVTEETRGKEKE